MGFIDRVVGYISPKAQYERNRYRMANDIFESQQRKYEAASGGRRTSGWKASSTSANTEIAGALSTLRNRSRQLVRDNSYARRIIKVVPNNVIGTGIVPTPRHTNANINKKVKAIWKEWAGKTACDFEGMHTIYGLQKLVMRCAIEGGECVVLKRRHKDGIIPFQLQVLEGDFIDTNKNSIQMDKGGYIVNGIEYDTDGRRIALWLFTNHPGDSYIFGADYKSRRIPLTDCIHIYQVERAGQQRGVPLMVSGMLKMKDFDEYEDAQLLKQKIAACFAAFVIDNADSVLKSEVASEADMYERIEPGIVQELPNGKDIKFANPPSTEGYGEYTKQVKQAIAAGVGITYEAMTGDYSNVNFSSGRMGWIEMQREVEDWQWNTFVPQFCDKIWDWFVEGLNMTGAVRGTVEVDWTTPRRMMIDPVKETNAKISQIEAGLVSRTEMLAEDGYDFDEMMQTISKEQKLIKSLDITLSTNPAQDVQEVKVQP